MKTSRLISVIFGSFAGVFALLFCYTTFTFVRYTPVYRPLECETLSSDFGPLRKDDSWINVTGTSRKTCWNPNEYDIHVAMVQPGSVFAREDGDNLRDIGRSHFEDHVYPARGKAKSEVLFEISMPIAEGLDLLAKPKVQIVTELHARDTGTIRYLGRDISKSDDLLKFCALEMLTVSQKVGPMACAYDLADIVVPNVNNSTSESWPQLLPVDMYAKNAHEKNLAFGLFFFLWSILSAVALALSKEATRAELASYWPSWRSFRKSTNDDNPCIKTPTEENSDASHV